MRASTRGSAAFMSHGVRKRRLVDSAAVRPYILVLMSEDDGSTPRLRAIAELCREVGRTEILAVGTAQRRPEREYDGTAVIERMSLDGEASRGVSLAPLFRRATRLAARCRRAAASGRHARVLRHTAGVAAVTLAGVSAATRQIVVAEVLRRRARALSLAPRIAVCHDTPTLLASIRLRTRYGCSVVYVGEAIPRRWRRGADVVVAPEPADAFGRARCRDILASAFTDGAAG